MNELALQQLNELNPDGILSLVDAFNITCEKYRERDAFACLDQTISYDELNKYSASFGSYLINDCGLNKGDRIAIQLPNIIQYPIAVWGALRAGLIVVNTNPMYTAREQTHQFNDSGSVALVVLENLLAVTKKVLPNTPIQHVIVASIADIIGDQNQGDDLSDKGLATGSCVRFNTALKAGQPDSLPQHEFDMQDLAVLQYTGGTTGPSKGAMLRHGNLFSAMKMSRKSIVLYEEGEHELPIAPLPLYHVFGFTANIIGVTLHGGLSVLIPDPRNMDLMINTMKKYPFTSMASVNTLLSGMMAHPEFDNVDFSHVKGIIAGGTTLVKEIAEEWIQRTDSRIFEGYGLSETSATACCNRPVSNVLGTVGPPMECQEIKIIDLEGNTCDTNVAGEVCIRGPQIMQGYWQNENATKESIDEDGWFKTGDIGLIEEHGHLKIVDRIKDMIIVSGFNVYPNEIEEVVYGHPNVTECAAIGVPNDATGEAIELYVVSNDSSLDSQSIIEFCRTELTAYKVPKRVHFRDDLPKSPAGKILRRELREENS